MTEVVRLPPDTYAQHTSSPDSGGLGMCRAPILLHRSTRPAQCAMTTTNSCVLMGATCPYGHEKVDMHLVSIPKGCKHH